MSSTPSEGSEGTTCSDSLRILNGNWDILETVLVTKTAVEAGHSPRTLNTTIVIGECDTGVVDRKLDDGDFISERINGCAADVKNHGQFVSCVAELTNRLKECGFISGKEKRAIQSPAAKAKITQQRY